MLEEFNFERVKFQFGGRIEHMRYKPTGAVERLHDHDHDDGETILLPKLDYTGLSGSAGMRLGLWQKGAFVAHHTLTVSLSSICEQFLTDPTHGLLTAS